VKENLVFKIYNNKKGILKDMSHFKILAESTKI